MRCIRSSAPRKSGRCKRSSSRKSSGRCLLPGSRSSSKQHGGPAGPPRKPGGFEMAAVVALEKRNSVGIVTVDYPPVNALSHAVRSGLSDALRQALADPAIEAVVLRCAGRTFIAGADITEFGKPPKEP